MRDFYDNYQINQRENLRQCCYYERKLITGCSIMPGSVQMAYLQSLP